MGGCLSTEKVEPVGREGVDRNSPDAKDEFDGPVKGRSCTDIIGIILLLGFTIALFVLVGRCMKYGDIDRVIYGYDNCGNICGQINTKEEDPKLSCKGGDYSSKKYLLIKEAGKLIYNPKNVNKECVEDCAAYPDYQKFLHRCIPKKSSEVVNTFFSKTGFKDFFHEVSEDLHLAWRELVYLALIALVLSLGTLFALRFFAGLMIWVILIGSCGMGAIGTVYAWVVYKNKKDEQTMSDIDARVATTYLVYAIITTVATVIMFFMVLVMRKRIKLVAELFTEAGKAVAKMPLLIFEPLLTFAALFVVIGLWLFFTIWIESSGYLTYHEPSFYYKKDFAMKFTRWYNLLGVFWMTQFVIGCQHMIIAGSVATWFFTRNKDNMESPILTSATNLVRYHLGSVALGSLFIALVQFVRAVLKRVEDLLSDPQNELTKALFKCCQCCLLCFEKCLAYLTRNAYVEICIYGTNFCESGQQAFKVLVNNALRVAAINTIGDFILFLTKVFVVLATLFFGTFFFENRQGIQHMWVLLSLACIFAYFVAHCFMTVYEMVIDTIFICFCEDCEMNDGLSKPYFMSKNLMEFVQNSNKVLKVGDSQPSDTPTADIQLKSADD
ncbi:Plasma-membrane choline transporter [Nesidiocoris tenuis]|uniref:Choline transporter-like protein n=1 Tax=Nesidiocoris tenuis TaxID=355587 RepID=A0ABN7BH80_9HEMI|nr:Plasma-membrane choline transporter [Nesidiocoris tenuis]